MNFNHENQKTLELRTEDAKDCDEWVAAIAHARYRGLPLCGVSLLLHPIPCRVYGPAGCRASIGDSKNGWEWDCWSGRCCAVPYWGGGTVGVGTAMLGRVGAASSGGRTDGEEGMAT